MTAASVLWRRVDTSGHDACRLLTDENGWQLSGTAVFRHEGAPASLTYSVAGDHSWRTRRGKVSGWFGETIVELRVTRSAGGGWIVNGLRVPGLDDLVDLDLGMTPATNLSQLRRVNLSVGQAADIPVAWLDVFAGTLTRLPQRYERRTDSTYYYESPTVPYAGLLELRPDGFIGRYPGLWVAEGLS